MRNLGFLIGFMFLLYACHASRVPEDGTPVQDGGVRVPDVGAQIPADVIIYKTSLDHTHHVPITLNETKDRVISFPAPGDLYFEGKLALPVPLEKGYLLDLRGISEQSVFASYTYEEYSRMDSAPAPEELLKHVIDFNPFVSIYSCGKAGDYKNLVRELNKKIRSGMEGLKPLLTEEP